MDMKIREHYGSLPAESWEEFAHFSANLQHILGIPFSARHFQEYTACRAYARRQAGLDLRAGITVPFADRNLARLAAGPPAMFVSFHFGSYRSVPLRILALGRSVCVVLSRDVLAKYSRYYSALLADPGDPDGPAGLLLLEAEDPSLFFKLRRAARRGMHAFVYADGARGARAAGNEQGQLISVELLSGRLGARSGYLDFAHMLDMGVHLLLDSALQPQLGFQGQEIRAMTLPWDSDRREVPGRDLPLLRSEPPPVPSPLGATPVPAPPGRANLRTCRMEGRGAAGAARSQDALGARPLYLQEVHGGRPGGFWLVNSKFLVKFS